MEKLVVGQGKSDVPTDGGVVFGHDRHDALSR
jgi:hypothetical protein